ncbi:MAG TPA: signal peptidase I [Edaphobacter sp.]|jgi:signal peptidase I|nr:signal peptidase I [Edaphobacter sp.]
MARGKEKSAGDERTDETPVEGFASLCSVLAVGLFVLTFVFQNFVIPSSSMASTLLVGDHVLVDRVSLAPSESWVPFVQHREVRRGEVIVFFEPPTEANGEHIFFVKRVIGVPGDRIHLRRGVVYLNGAAQDEPQAAKPTYTNYSPYRDDFPSVVPPENFGVTAEWSVDLPNHIEGDDLVVPPESYFVMGDNRTNSLDGRYWGFVPRANIVGRPMFVYWSFPKPENESGKTKLSDEASFTLHEIVHFFDETRWRRTFHVVE